MVRMPHWPKPSWNRQLSLGLERVKLLLQVLGNPERNIKNIVHVAGTNGKGSTIAFLRSILEQSGKKVNVYTSPHLIRFNERIVINSQEINDGYLYEILERTRFAQENLNVEFTFFEVVTAACFIAFAENEADYNLIEVGMGGRLDPTNVLEDKLMTITTPISLDHTDFLGNEVKKIAWEKCQIFRPNNINIISQQYPEVMDLLINYADEIGSSNFSFEYDYVLRQNERNNMYLSSKREYCLPELSLVGEHQLINAACAIAAADNLLENLIEDKLSLGLTKAKWIGRLEKIEHGHIASLLPSKNWQLWVDGAHNEAGSYILSLWVKEQNCPVYILTGLTKGRDVSNFFGPLKNVGVKGFACVYINNEASSYSSEILSEKLLSLGFPAFGASSIEAAIESLIMQEPGIILACGSLYLAGEIIQKNYNISC